MDTIFVNLQNSKTSGPHVLILKFTDKIDLRRGEKSVVFSSLGIYYIQKNIINSYSNSKFKISVPRWNNEFELPDESSVSDIQDYWQSILKKNNESIDNSPIRIYMKKIENIITFQIKIGHYLEILIPETKKLLGSTKNKIAKAKIDKNVPHLELTKVILVCCNIFNNNYQQDSRVSYTFVSNKPFGQLLEISPTDFIFLKIFNLVF